MSINKTRGKSVWTANIIHTGGFKSSMSFGDFNRARSFVRRNIEQIGSYGS